MKKILFLLTATCLVFFSGCTTVGQQITNRDGVITVCQTDSSPKTKVSTTTSVQTPLPSKQQPPKQISPKPPQNNDIIIETTYESRRVIGSYVVIQ